MSLKYNPKKIEKKWQTVWDRKKVYAAKDFDKRKKFYALFEFPYPSGDGLHVGHLRPYIGMDIIARKRRMEGYNVLFPIGWDAFGLPTENYAIKTGIAPHKATKKNTDTFRKQMKSLGLSLDWGREINTTDPEYYKWTQWMFLEFFKAGMAYKAKVAINWCPRCKIGLANEEAAGGICERCGGPVEKKDKEQWMLRITKYAEELLEGLKEVDFIPEAKIQQENWIGKSEGTVIRFPLISVPGQPDKKHFVDVFTTRPDTIFGATFLAISPEIAQFWLDIGWQADESIRSFVKSALKERNNAAYEEVGKQGIFTGISAINPANKEKIPVWISEYVLFGYGTGAIMGVPAHDERDFEFAKKYKLSVEKVILPAKLSSIPRNAEDIAAGAKQELRIQSDCWEGGGELINSGKFSGMDSEKAKWEITEFVNGKREIKYKLRDWVFSRQRYWGEPIPLVFCAACHKKLKGISNEQFSISNDGLKNFSRGELENPGWVPLLEKDLPLKLPRVKKYEPTDTGESPLASVEKWVNVKCPRCGERARRETDVMPNWAGSSWYFLRYIDPKNKKEFADKKKLKYWMQVDWYNGGMEHTVLHLLYSRFWNRFLSNQGQVPVKEPYKKRTSHGLILAEDGGKMSKSKGNVVNPDNLVSEFGADALRMYEMFLGPFDQAVAWSSRGILGTERFLKRVWEIGQNTKLIINNKQQKENKKIEQLLHKTIKKVTEDIEAMAFNTAVSAMMIFINEVTNNKQLITKNIWETFLKLLFPFAPHTAEELWEHRGHKTLLAHESWPEYEQPLTVDETFELIIQVNGKIKDKITVDMDIHEAEAQKQALESEKVKDALQGKPVKRVIFVKGKLINLVV